MEFPAQAMVYHVCMLASPEATRPRAVSAELRTSSQEVQGAETGISGEGPVTPPTSYEEQLQTMELEL